MEGGESRVNLFHYARFSPRGSSDTTQLGRKCTSEFTEMVKDIYLLWKECICIGSEINLAVTNMFKYEFKTWLKKEIISFPGGYQEPVRPTGYFSVKEKYWFKIWDRTQHSLIALFLLVSWPRRENCNLFPKRRPFPSTFFPIYTFPACHCCILYNRKSSLHCQTYSKP